MQLEWYGQSAFRLTDGATTVFIDPFDDLGALTARGLRWDYPGIAGVAADLLLVTHEHRDHNGVGAIGGDPVTLRSTAGRLDSPIGEVVAVAAEIATRLRARVVVPMHYRTERIDFLEPVDAFVERIGGTQRLESAAFELDALPDGDGPLALVPAAP
jgi:L-ascorbate metabolism protein UlaG (beta-lactamase superfamily)